MPNFDPQVPVRDDPRNAERFGGGEKRNASLRWPGRRPETGRISRRLRVAGFTLVFAAVAATAAEVQRVELGVADAASGQPLPVRIHLRSSAAEGVRAPGLPFWHDHFVCPGRVALDLTPGRYVYEIERGPEWTMARGEIAARAGGEATLTHRLSRLVDLAREGWWSGDLHVHRGAHEAELLLRAEDLHVAPFISWWNQANPWTNQPLPTELPVRFDATRAYHPLAGEDERDGGALLFFNLDRPVDITGGTEHYPSSLSFARTVQARPGAWIDIEKPFWWDLPLWLAHGVGDSIGLANNHLYRDGGFDNEAWGRPRDRVAYPPAWGNGLWSHTIYYHLLNAGFRLPPSAGSASGVLPNPVGYNRVYVHLDGGFDWNRWWEGLRSGRCFVSNGPLLRVRANGQWPGHVFRSPGPLAVLLEATLDSRDPVAAVELVRNGRVDRVPFPSLITIQESGWFLVRAIADVPHTLRFASTAPWYVEIGDQPRPVRRDSARFFLDWTQERLAILNTNTALTPEQKAEVVQPWRVTESFWQERVQQAVATTRLTGQVRDARTGQPLASRLYLQHADGRWCFPISAAPDGSAQRYERRNWANPQAVEYHTTLSAHPFAADLEPGRYTVTVERGKEYRPWMHTFDVGSTSVTLEVPLERWINLAERGWYSGDTHVHRTLDELPNVQLAEDLNVTFPLTYWVTQGFASPTQGDKASGKATPENLVTIDPTHVIWPRNTEWEIFTLHGQSHTLGAVFALGHRTPFTRGAPPVRPLAEQARREGALLDLDKHDWPWSMTLPPLMDVDLYELANNHHWRTAFGITQWSSKPPAWMQLPTTPTGGDERAWTLYGFQNYYALLNCGFRLQPTAGTASGVHPVPLGFGRVYVHLPDGFSYRAWLKGLKSGRSFVTTGPMLFVECPTHEVRGTVLSESPVPSVEIVLNGVVHTRALTPRRNTEGAWEAHFREPVRVPGTHWVAVRCFEPRPADRFRFAHTAPFWFEVPDQPLKPRRAEAEFLVQRVRDELERSRNRLPPEALAEYQHALEVYEAILRRAE